MSESKSGWSELEAGVTRPAGDRHTLQVDQAIAHVITVAAPAFEATAAVLLPDGPRPRRLEDGITTGLSLVAQALQHAMDHRDHKLTVAGHSQGFGNTRGEISLSSRRAGNVLCYLRGERERWIAACACHTEVDLRRISAWANGTYRANLDPKQFDRAAWGAVFDLYDRHVAALLGKKDLSEARAALSFEDPPMVACGAFWPYGGGSRRIDPNQRSAMPVTATASRDSRVDLLFRQPGPELPAQPEDQAPGTRLYMTARYVCRKPIAAPPTPAAACVRLSGMYFDTNKCFLLESALSGIARLVALQAQNPGSSVLVVGHTDTSGDPAYNDTLSLERAQAVVAYLRDDVDAWLAWYDDSKPVKKRWGVVEDECMFRRVRGGQALSKEAIRAYQRDRGLDDDGVIGPKTRRALIGDYMAVDGTSLPTDAQTTAHGCGESFPVVDAGDGVDEQRNRRVELFVFPTAIEPAPAGDISKAGSTEYPQWSARLVETIEVNVSASKVLSFAMRINRDVEAHYDTVLCVVQGDVEIARLTATDPGVVHDAERGVRTYTFDTLPIGLYDVCALIGEQRMWIALGVEIGEDGAYFANREEALPASEQLDPTEGLAVAWLDDEVALPPNTMCC